MNDATFDLPERCVNGLDTICTDRESPSEWATSQDSGSNSDGGTHRRIRTTSSLRTDSFGEEQSQPIWKVV